MLTKEKRLYQMQKKVNGIDLQSAKLRLRLSELDVERNRLMVEHTRLMQEEA